MVKNPKITCISSGLIAIDMVCLSPRYSPDSPMYLQAGGSCGNVAAIVASAGHRSVPIARLGIDPASDMIRGEFADLGIDIRFLSNDRNDKAPIVFQYLKNDGNGGHRFDLRHPVTRKHLPQFKPVTKDYFKNIVSKLPQSDVFYADRITPGTVQLATALKEQGSLIFFEPQKMTMNDFERILPVVDVLKYSQGRFNELNDVSFPKRTVIIIETLGNSGVRFQCANSRISPKWTSVPPTSIIRAVDTAGAGDWMTAYMICESLTSLKNKDSDAIANHLSHASAWSLLAILFPGARGVLRHLSMELVKVLARNLLRADSANEQVKIIEHESRTVAMKANIALSSLHI